MNSYNRVYVHFVWAPWDRAKLITPEIETVLFRAIAAACRKLNGQPIEINGTEDHVHVLARLPGTGRYTIAILTALITGPLKDF